MADPRNGGGKTKGDRHRKSRNKNVAVAATGVAIGIGSAALVAALMYANRPQEDESETIPDPRFEPRDPCSRSPIVRALAADHPLRQHDPVERRFVDQAEREARFLEGQPLVM